MSADEVLMLCIVGGYFLVVAAICWRVGQLLLALVDLIAECLERRWQRHDHKQAQAMPHGQRSYAQRVGNARRRYTRHH